MATKAWCKEGNGRAFRSGHFKEAWCQHWWWQNGRPLACIVCIPFEGQGKLPHAFWFQLVSFQLRKSSLKRASDPPRSASALPTSTSGPPMPRSAACVKRASGRPSFSRCARRARFFCAWCGVWGVFGRCTCERVGLAWGLVSGLRMAGLNVLSFEVCLRCYI